MEEGALLGEQEEQYEGNVKAYVREKEKEEEGEREAPLRLTRQIPLPDSFCSL